MSWLSVITGLFRPAKELIEVFKPNAEMEAMRGHEETMALSQQDLAALRSSPPSSTAASGGPGGIRWSTASTACRGR